MINKTERN